MKKFKVIEESRFLNKNNMSQINGGTSCDQGKTHNHCGTGNSGSLLYGFCRPIANSGGYKIDGICVRGGVNHESCGGPGYEYTVCIVNGPNGTMCSGSKVF